MIELHVGQVVPWPHAPGGIAQIDDLRRCRVGLVYRCLSGRLRRPTVSVYDAARLLRSSAILPLDNLMNRGVLKRSKRYRLW